MRLFFAAALVALLAGTPIAIADDGTSGTRTIEFQVEGPGQIWEGDIPICNDYPCSEEIYEGELLELAALADDGAVLDRWEGACSGTDPICTVTADQDKTVTAVFSYLNPGEPSIRKVGVLKSNSLQVRVGCGGSTECGLEITGRLIRGGSKIGLPKVEVDLEAGERRTVQLLGGKGSGRVRNQLKQDVKARRKAKLEIQVTDIDTGKASRMAINEKPPCCPWPKKNKSNK